VKALRLGADAPFRRLVGVGGIGGGMFLALEGDATLGREESRGAHLLDARDACKLHIVAHHVAVLLGADPSGTPFHVAPLGWVGDDDPGRPRHPLRRAGIVCRLLRSPTVRGNTSHLARGDDEQTRYHHRFRDSAILVRRRLEGFTRSIGKAVEVQAVVPVRPSD
jgi:hypothetical protein